MIVELNKKKFRLTTFSPIIGRELMLKGDGCKKLFGRGLDAWLPILAYIQVNIIDEHWIALSTKAMVENHVPEGMVEELLLLQLQHNCYAIKALLDSPSMADTLWAELADVIEQVSN